MLHQILFNLTFSNVQGAALSVTASAQFIADLPASVEDEQT
ncbi:hypothetical protein [Nocardiopsis sp. CC223A]|nr:hypothetical protein [Nocardiopsis sp. CC223A]